MSCHGIRAWSTVEAAVPGQGKLTLIPDGFDHRRSAPGRYDVSLWDRAGINSGQPSNRSHCRHVYGIVAANIGCTAKRALSAEPDNTPGRAGQKIPARRRAPRSVCSAVCPGDEPGYLIVSRRDLLVETSSGRASISRTSAASGESIGPGRSHHNQIVIVACGGESEPVAGSVPHMELHLPDVPIAPRRRDRTTSRRADQRRPVSDLPSGSPAPAGRARPNPTPARRPVPAATVPGRRRSRWCLARRSIR